MSDGVNVSLQDALEAMADVLVRELEADACAVSRVIGDVLILIAERHDGETLQLGQGYLISDYPLTRAVLATGEPRTLTLDDPDVDRAEATTLRDLGYGSLLMLALELNGARWGLVEVYRRGTRPFDGAAVDRALELTRVD